MAEASFDQARKTFDKFLAGAHATAGTIEEKRRATVRSSAKEVSAKACPTPRRTCRRRSITPSRC